MDVLNVISRRFVMRATAVRNYCNISPRVQKASILSQESTAAFQRSLPVILQNAYTKSGLMPEIIKRMEQIIDQNLMIKGTLAGALTVNAYEVLEDSENVTEKSLQDIHVLAWCAEMFNSFFSMLENIQDAVTMTPTQDGDSTCLLLPDFASNSLALNDTILYKSFMLEVLKQNIGDSPLYGNFLSLFHKVFLYTSFGRHIENKTTKKHGLDKFTMENYDLIVENKSYYVFKLPVLLVMTLTSKSNEELQRHVNNIFNNIGKLYQIQKDFSDCYAEPDKMGIDSIAIPKGKCTWLAIKALHRCNPAQRRVFTACYGSNQPAHIERVKRLYDQLNLPKLYKQEELQIYCDISQKVRKLNGIPHDLFLRPLDFVYRKGYLK